MKYVHLFFHSSIHLLTLKLKFISPQPLNRFILYLNYRSKDFIGVCPRPLSGVEGKGQGLFINFFFSFDCGTRQSVHDHLL